MKNEEEKHKLKKIFNNEFYNKTYSQKDDFRKIDNTYLAKSVANKSAIILFQKESKNKEIHNYNNIVDNNNFVHNFRSYKNKINYDKISRPLNNTFQKINNVKFHDNNLNNNKNRIKKSKNIKNFKIKVSSTNHSGENYSKINKNINAKTNNNITNISVCLTNINMIHKNEDNYSPSFFEVNKRIKIKNNKNNMNKIRCQTFDHNFGSYNKKYIYNSTFFENKNNKKEKDKNKTLMEKKMRYFLDYCKEDIESFLLSSSDPKEEENNESKNFELKNNTISSKLKKINNKRSNTTNNLKKSNNYKSIDKKRHFILNNERFNTFNLGSLNISEINNSNLNYYSHNISTINNKNNKNEKKSKKKPRVDTFEYLAKILNSINTNNLIKSLKKGKINEEMKNPQKEKTDYFRQKHDKNIVIKNKKFLNERRFNKNNDIKKYMENKKKLVKMNDIQKKKKGKEDELKKYLELYKLQEKILNHNNGNNLNYINDINEKYISKTKNDFYCGKNKSKKKYKKKKNNNSNEIIISSESTIIDKSNYYQNILDIQNIYNQNNFIINNNILNNEKENKFNMIISNENKEINNNDNAYLNIIKNEGKKINIEDNKVNKIELNQNNIEIKTDKKTVNKIKDEKIFSKCQNTLEKANKIIGGKKVEYLINNFKNIYLSNEPIEMDEENSNIPIYDYTNDYSFKLNDSNSNEINSYHTSKFCNSQIYLEEKEKNNDDIKEINNENDKREQIEKNIIFNNSFKKEENYNFDDGELKNNIPSIQLPPTIQIISGNNTLEENNNKNTESTNDKKVNSIEKKYNLDEEKLENYREILSSLFEYLKLITQRNALNDIITYGDMKYKYKIGFEQLIILIKSIPFNIIRAIQQSQYYSFVFRQFFIPFIARAFKSIKIYSSYNKFYSKINHDIKIILKKIIFRKIKYYKKVINQNKDIDNDKSITIKSLEEISELKDSNYEIKNNKNEKKNKNESEYIYNYSEKDISESKEIDSIEWDNNFFIDKQKTNRDNSNIINNFTKIYKNENSYSADFNLNIKEISFEDENQ